MEDRQESMERLQALLFAFMSERTGGKLTVAMINDKCRERDWWLTPQEAFDLGLIDEII